MSAVSSISLPPRIYNENTYLHFLTRYTNKNKNSFISIKILSMAGFCNNLLILMININPYIKVCNLKKG